jgi:glycosyltransferase involved in cell wall biosynthesis
MSVYFGDKPSFLQRSLDSIRCQTVLPSEVVLVVDGDIPADLDHVVKTCFSGAYLQIPAVLVRLEANAGLANAMNVGLEKCSWPWIARMDCDDVAVPERIERQWGYLQTHNDIDLLASWHRDCGLDGVPLGRVKKIPEHHRQIIRRLKWRNIISHPTVIYRKEMVIEVGGYNSGLSLQEDYDLFVRLAVNGARFAACQLPLVNFTTDEKQRIRRGGISYLIRCEWPTRWNMVKCGFLSIPFAIASALLRTAFILSPSDLKWFLYGFVRSEDQFVADRAGLRSLFHS